jgi:hypothetical protein
MHGVRINSAHMQLRAFLHCLLCTAMLGGNIPGTPYGVLVVGLRWLLASVGRSIQGLGEFAPLDRPGPWVNTAMVFSYVHLRVFGAVWGTRRSLYSKKWLMTDAAQTRRR